MSNYFKVTASQSNVGQLGISQGAAWLDIDAADLTTLTDTAIDGTEYFSWVSVLNTHGSQTLFVLLRKDAAAGTATTEAIAVPAGASMNQETIRANGGSPVRGISIQGSGAATTGVLTVGLLS